MYEYSEPKPITLTGPIGRAWERILIGHEWFDGEDGIAAGAQNALLREWTENAPSMVTIVAPYGTRTADSISRHYFMTRVEAEAFADASGAEPELVNVIPVTRVSVHERANVPVQFRPAKWPESRW